jgi:hypothetical protein
LKYKSIVILPLILLAIAIYGVNNKHTSIYTAVNKISTGFNDYSEGAAVKSVDKRLAMIVNGFIITKESPWIGTGIGSINQAHINNFDKLSIRILCKFVFW